MKDRAFVIEALLEKRASLMTELRYGIGKLAETNAVLADELTALADGIGDLDAELTAKLIGSGGNSVNGREQSQSVPAPAPAPDLYGIPERVYQSAHSQSKKRGGKARALAILAVAMKPGGPVDVRNQLLPVVMRAGLDFGERRWFFKNVTHALDKRWFQYDRGTESATLKKRAYDDFA